MVGLLTWDVFFNEYVHILLVAPLTPRSYLVNGCDGVVVVLDGVLDLLQRVLGVAQAERLVGVAAGALGREVLEGGTGTE